MRMAIILLLGMAVTASSSAGKLDELIDAGQPALEDAPAGALVLDGEPAATVVIRERPTDDLVFAAETLQSYIRQITGASLPVVTDKQEVAGNRVLLGLSDVSRPVRLLRDLDDEGYVLQTDGRDVIVCGGSDRGTVYGVAGLLHDVGVRWYVPGDDLGTCVPQMDDIVLADLNERHEPSFPMRWVGRGTDWATFNGQNCPGDTLEASFKIEPNIYHTQHRLLPHNENFGEHPDYYALINGKRSQQRHCKLCYSSDECARAVAAEMAALKTEDPRIGLLSFSPTDGQMWCECEECVALDEEDVPSDQAMSRRSLLFYNNIAKYLRTVHPDAEMLVGAYNVYNWPPRDTSIEADPMLSVIITHYQDYCMAHPIADESCPRNRRYVELIERWDRLGTPVYYYEYYWKVNWLDLPWPIVHSIAEDMPWYHSRGDRGVYTQFNPQNAWTLYPAYYMAARLLWDVETDVDAVFDEMCNRLYGPAGPAIREYYRLMEDAFADGDLHFPGNATSVAPQIFTDELMAKLREQLDRAHQLADSDLIEQRLAKLELSYEYTTRLLEYLELRDRDDLATAKRTLQVIEDLVTEVRQDREKWDGVISTSVVRSGYYLGREYENTRARVEARVALDAIDTQQGENLLTNPSFEATRDGGVLGWEDLPATHEQTGRMSLTDTARTGDSGLRFSADTLAQWKGEEYDWVTAHTVSEKVPAREADVFAASAWVRIDEGMQKTDRGAVLEIVGYDEQGNSAWPVTSFEANRVEATDGWVQMKIAMRVTRPKTKTVGVRLGISGIGTLVYDDLRLMRLDLDDE